MDEAVVFDLDGGAGIGARVAAGLGLEVAPHEERRFEGGEHKTRPLVNVRGRDCYVHASLDGDGTRSANDKLCRLLFFVGGLRDASARTVTAVVPYLCYSRKDRRTKARDPVTTRYVAQVLEAAGVDRVVTVDVHNLAAFQNAFRCVTDHIEATELFADHLVTVVGDRPVSVVSPDIGGTKRAERFQNRLAARLDRPVGLAVTEKFRSEDRLSGRAEVLGDVSGRVAVVYDDLIASGATMRRVAEVLGSQGATETHLVATHGLFTPAAHPLFDTGVVASVIVTDSVAPGRLDPSVTGDALVVIELAPLLAEAIERIHRGGSISTLLHLDT